MKDLYKKIWQSKYTIKQKVPNCIHKNANKYIIVGQSAETIWNTICAKFRGKNSNLKDFEVFSSSSFQAKFNRVNNTIFLFPYDNHTKDEFNKFEEIIGPYSG